MVLNSSVALCELPNHSDADLLYVALSCPPALSSVNAAPYSVFRDLEVAENARACSYYSS